MEAPPAIPRSHTYELLQSDLFIANLTLPLRNRLLRGMVLIAPVYLGVLRFARTEATEATLIVRLVSALGAMVLGAASFAILFTITVVILVYARKNKGVVGVHTLVLTPEGLVERTEYNEALIRWKGFYRIHETSTYLYLYVTESNQYQIPKRSFASTDEVKSFLDEIKRRSSPA